ncbi:MULTISPECIES: hypothetical protein [unclassified Streptomyces]|uniref:hypothetical protein n=1 Tax=unclassified Streptomyces TaxID=2593676 RepID=UPI002741DCCE|nr:MULTISPECIES: hypothetical protein [unclassified Streptomyces]
MSLTLHTLAGRVAAFGGLGSATMALYMAALRRVDFDLIPSSAMPRVRWWSAHAPMAFFVGLLLTVIGLVLLVAT